MTGNLPFEPAPGSQADLDYEMWQTYLSNCHRWGLKPGIEDYAVWLEEQLDESTDQHE